MKELLFTACVFGAFLFGYFLMGRVDLFLKRNRKAPEEENEVEEPACIMLTGNLTDEEIEEEIRHFRSDHAGAKIFLCDRDHPVY